MKRPSPACCRRIWRVNHMKCGGMREANTQPAANGLKTDLSVRPIVPLASAKVSSPVQAISATVIARPANGETMQIVDAQGKVLDMYAEDSGNADSRTAAAPSDYKTVLSGQPTRERLVKQDVTWLRIGVPLQQQSGVAGALYLSAPIQEDINNTKQLYVLIALMALGIAAAGWAAIYLLLRKLTQPLRQLAHAALQVADGQYSPELPAVHGIKEQELRQLISSFGDMTSRLKQLEQMRTDLLAGVSHELRTPLTSIRGMVQAVHGRVVAGIEADEFLQISLEEAKRMQSMVDDLLEFSSLEAGAIKTERDKGPLSPLIRSVIQQLRSLPSLASIQLNAVLPDEELECDGDQGQLKQILTNLIINSSAAGATEIAVEAAVVEKDIVIEVRDNGGGIRESEVPFIFERYYRGSSRRKKKQGLGLGLPLSRLLARANGGDLVLHSTSEAGTVFRLSLPKPPAIAARGCPCSGRPLCRSRLRIKAAPQAALLHRVPACRPLQTGRACQRRLTPLGYRRGLYPPIRQPHEAEPSQVCGLPAQHQPSFGRPPLIHSAVTLRSPQREASREKPLFFCNMSG